MTNDNNGDESSSMSNLTLGLLLALFALLWFLTAIFWVYYSSYGTISG